MQISETIIAMSSADLDTVRQYFTFVYKHRVDGYLVTKIDRRGGYFLFNLQGQEIAMPEDDFNAQFKFENKITQHKLVYKAGFGKIDWGKEK